MRPLDPVALAANVRSGASGLASFSRKRFRLYAREVIAATLCLTGLGIAAAVFFSQIRPSWYRLTISGGSSEGLRSQIAERLAEEARSRQLNLRLVPTAGSRETLDLIDARKLDVALVQGGLDPTHHPHVRQVAALHIEPLHLLVKPALRPLVGESLRAIRGKTVNLGPAGSGTHDLALDVLRFAGLEPKRADGTGDYIVATLTYRDLLDSTNTAELPDVVFTVSALPSPVVRTLVARHHYHLVELPFGEAFALDALNRRNLGTPELVGADSSDVTKLQIQSTAIPAFTYGVEPPVPPMELQSFGPRLLLVAHEAVASQAVRRLLETVFSPRFAQLTKPPLDATNLSGSPEYPLHDGTLEYIEFNKPLVAGDVIDLLEKGTSLIGGVLGGAFFLWQWVRHRYRRKRELGFETYMVKVAEIEEKALGLEMQASLDLGELLKLQRDLGRLKNQALARFAEGKLEGEQLISGFVSHVNDARNYLNRLILHERENLEDRASELKRPTQALWDETVGAAQAEPETPASEGSGASHDGTERLSSLAGASG
jgi:TRAP-type uncharacterized transport system substrate-binding protein